MPQPTMPPPDFHQHDGLQPDALSDKPDCSKLIWTPADPHVTAAKCHEMAAQHHYDAARHHAEGDHGQAGLCAMQAQEHSERAMHHGKKCCRYYLDGTGST